MNHHSQTVFNSIIMCNNINNCLCTNANSCKNIICYQNQFSVHWHSCEPWNGKIDEAPILFLLSNPSYSADDIFPYYAPSVPPCKMALSPNPGWTIPDISDFFEYRFDSRYVQGLRPLKVNGTYGRVVPTWRNLCKYAFAVKYGGVTSVKDLRNNHLPIGKKTKIDVNNVFSIPDGSITRTIKPGDDFVISEVVKCKSQMQIGITQQTITQCSSHCQNVIGLFVNAPTDHIKTICVCGKLAQSEFAKIYGPLSNPKVVGSYQNNNKVYDILRYQAHISGVQIQVYYLPHPADRIYRMIINGINV